MRSKDKLKSISIFLLFSVALCTYNPAGAAEQEKKKKYPHPHTVHLEAMSQTVPDFFIGEISDWTSFSKSLQSVLKTLPFSPGSRVVMSNFKPEDLSSDEKAIVISELNRLLGDESLGAQVKHRVTFTGETRKLESNYIKTKNKEDLKWMNRSILSDLFPQITRKERTGELKKMTCATCHEAWGLKAWGQVEKADEKEPYKDAVGESAAMECFSKAIAGEKAVEDCVEMVNAIKKSRIEPYGPLKNYIRRSDIKEEIPFFAAVHPENPYTFKPLLKKLVCLECHGQERKVTKVKGKDGKLKDITVFYGLGIKKRHEHDNDQSKEDQN